MIFNLYPNPNNGLFSLEFTNPIQNEHNDIVIADLSGKIVYHCYVFKDEKIKKFNLSFLKTGIYILIVANNKMRIAKQILIK